MLYIMKNKKLTNSEVVGIHYIIDLFGCNRQQINSDIFLKKVFADSIKGTDIILLNESFYKFDPQGVTGYFLLANSHMSLHSWPEHGYLSIDIYTCSSSEMTRKLVDSILEKISHEKVFIKNIDRTYDLIDLGKKNTTLEMPIYANGDNQLITVTKWQDSIVSAFQKIDIVDTKEFGRCMIINDIMQTSEYDHEIYDNQILASLSDSDTEIIILGGGDGYVASMALAKNPKLKITIIDLDVEVVAAAKKYLKQSIFDNPNVTLYIGDALQYLKTRSGKKVDGIISDLTDNPVVALEENYKKDFTHFFEQLLPLMSNHLVKNGWLSIQAGASVVDKNYFDTASILKKIVKTKIGNVTRKDVFIPSFGEDNCFITAIKQD